MHSNGIDKNLNQLRITKNIFSVNMVNNLVFCLSAEKMVWYRKCFG